MPERRYQLLDLGRPDGIPVWMCPDDGCFVLDTSIHEVWHDQLEHEGAVQTCRPWTTREIAADLHVGVATVRRWIDRDFLHAGRCGNVLRVHDEDYQRFKRDFWAGRLGAET